MKPIMQNIAKLAGVSLGTVSNALNNRKGVGEDTKVKILKIAEELGYFQNQKKDEDKIIKLILFKKHGYILSSDTQFFSNLIQSCENECRENGHELLISQVIYGQHNKEDILKTINQNKIDGILLLATEMDEFDISDFENLDVPMVVVDSHFDNKSYDYVLINNMNGSYEATKFLIENNHKRIGLLGSMKNIKNFDYRYKGFIKAIEDFGLEFNKKYAILVEPTLDGAYSDMKLYLKDNKCDLPTALFALNDIIALGAMKAILEEGIKIPDDISIIGFDDISFSSLSNPSLTTIKVYTDEIGKIAVKRLLSKIEEDCITLKIEVDTQLVIRDSVKHNI